MHQKNFKTQASLLRCKKCFEAREFTKCWIATPERRKIAKHWVLHHDVETKDEPVVSVQRESALDSTPLKGLAASQGRESTGVLPLKDVGAPKIPSYEDAVAFAVLHSGIDDLQAESILKALEGQTVRPMSRKVIRDKTGKLIEVSVKELRKRIDAAPYLCVAFDGGISKALKQHLLIITVYVKRACYVLDPVIQPRGRTWNGDGISAAVLEMFTKYEIPLDKVKHAMVDGLRANNTAIYALEHMAGIVLTSRLSQ